MDRATAKLGAESSRQHTNRRNGHTWLFHARRFQTPQKRIILRSGSDIDFVFRLVLGPQAQQEALRLSTLGTVRVGSQSGYARVLYRSVLFGPSKQAHGVAQGKEWTAQD